MCKGKSQCPYKQKYFKGSNGSQKTEYAKKNKNTLTT